jgi:hypothetical protein
MYAEELEWVDGFSNGDYIGAFGTGVDGAAELLRRIRRLRKGLDNDEIKRLKALGKALGGKVFKGTLLGFGVAGAGVDAHERWKKGESAVENVTRTTLGATADYFGGVFGAALGAAGGTKGGPWGMGIGAAGGAVTGAFFADLGTQAVLSFAFFGPEPE